MNRFMKLSPGAAGPTPDAEPAAPMSLGTDLPPFQKKLEADAEAARVAAAAAVPPVDPGTPQPGDLPLVPPVDPGAPGGPTPPDPNAQPAPEGGKPPETDPKLLAGKYKDQTALEFGYQNLHAESLRIKAELKQLRTEATQNRPQPGAAGAEPAPVIAAVAEVKFIDSPEAKAALKALVPEMGEGGVAAIQSLLDAQEQHNQSRFTKYQEESEARHRSSDEGVAFDRAERAYFEATPTANEYRSDINTIMDDILEKGTPPDMLLSLIHAKAVFNDIPNIIEKAVGIALKNAGVKEGARDKAGNIVSGPSGGGGQPGTVDPAVAAMHLKQFGFPMKGN